MTPDEVDAAIEVAAVGTEGVARVLAEVLAWLTNAWLRDVGSVRTAADAETARPILTELRRRLAALPEVDTAPLRQGYRRAYAAEYGQRDVTPQLDLRDTIDDMRAAMRRREVDTARGLAALAKADTVRWGDVRRATAPAMAAASDVRSAAVRAVMAGQHDGVTARARREKTDLIVEPERNACLYCLSFAGAVAVPGEDFTPREDYLPKVPVPWLRPQFHPNCRCRLRLFRSASEADRMLRDALIREADRSVLRGTTEYGSEAARFRAAGRLLEQIAKGDTPARVPKTVRERGSRAVRRGKFPDRPDRPQKGKGE